MPYTNCSTGTCTGSQSTVLGYGTVLYCTVPTGTSYYQYCTVPCCTSSTPLCTVHDHVPVLVRTVRTCSSYDGTYGMPYYLTVLVVVLYGTALECPPVESIEYTNVMYCDRVQL